METIERPSLKVITNELEYQASLELIKDLMSSGVKANSDNENYLEVLSILIEKYEEEKGYKIESSLADSIEVLNYYLSENGLQQKDLVPVLGPASRVSEIMNRKRSLSLKQIKRLNQAYNIPVELLVD
ncbi:HTH-type transcriptional regulator/antitoxin HigA [Algoriphagus sp. 4150]|uniref:helix-turn-helix domain-containing protein n=1 Tax=Algoriphagus sp. 4150 TaxID=2817756 RepID=UPI00285AC7F3|nr:transcriptional regulator [Algoriphagus sp. 4150]MDR7132265.1 HTH-type transcriptional regulator/antitoxin HigA [Algoriphagus sp. 4150]